jgi:large subunit ribosomal protein L30
VTEAAKKTTAKKSGGDTVKVRLVKSGICTPKDQKATLRGIGFRRLGEELTRVDSPSLRGMLRKVRHLVEVKAAK